MGHRSKKRRTFEKWLTAVLIIGVNLAPFETAFAAGNTIRQEINIIDSVVTTASNENRACRFVLENGFLSFLYIKFLMRSPPVISILPRSIPLVQFLLLFAPTRVGRGILMTHSTSFGGLLWL